MTDLSNNLPDPYLKDTSSNTGDNLNPPLSVNNLPIEVAKVRRELEKDHERMVKCDGRIKLFQELIETGIGTGALEGFLGKFLGK